MPGLEIADLANLTSGHERTRANQAFRDVGCQTLSSGLKHAHVPLFRFTCSSGRLPWLGQNKGAWEERNGLNRMPLEQILRPFQNSLKTLNISAVEVKFQAKSKCSDLL